MKDKDKYFINLICDAYNETSIGVIAVSDEAFDQKMHDNFYDEDYYNVVYLEGKKLHVYDLSWASEVEAGIAALFARENTETMAYGFIFENAVWGCGNKQYIQHGSHNVDKYKLLNIFVGDEYICGTVAENKQVNANF